MRERPRGFQGNPFTTGHRGHERTLYGDREGAFPVFSVVRVLGYWLTAQIPEMRS